MFTVLGERDLSAGQVAAQIGCDARRLSRLLYALAHVGLLEVTGGRFRNGIEAADVLAGKPGFIGGAHELIAKVWTANLNTAESIRTGKPIAEHDFSTTRPEETAALLRGPGGVAFGRTLAGMLDLSRAESVIDIGGGAGTVLAGLRERWPHFKATLEQGCTYLRAFADQHQCLGVLEPLGECIGILHVVIPDRDRVVGEFAKHASVRRVSW